VQRHTESICGAGNRKWTVFAQTTEEKKREDFRRFLDAVLVELPTDKKIHVILDNYSTRR